MEEILSRSTRLLICSVAACPCLSCMLAAGGEGDSVQVHLAACLAVDLMECPLSGIGTCAAEVLMAALAPSSQERSVLPGRAQLQTVPCLCKGGHTLFLGCTVPSECLTSCSACLL